MEYWTLAGDWMKIEKDTPDKPEILALARILSCSPDEAFGKCFRFWRWADSQLSNGNAPGVSEIEVDALVGRHGFADGLIKVGWLQVRNGSLVVPNFDRHMSESAKKRGLTAKRVSRFKERSGNDLVTHDALAEKRREEKSIGGKPPITPGARVFQKPTVDQVRAYCEERSNSVDPESFVDFYESKGWLVGKSKMKNWQAAVRNWEKHEAKKPKPGEALKEPPPLTREQVEAINAGGDLT